MCVCDGRESWVSEWFARPQKSKLEARNTVVNWDKIGGSSESAPLNRFLHVAVERIWSEIKKSQAKAAITTINKMWTLYCTKFAEISDSAPLLIVLVYKLPISVYNFCFQIPWLPILYGKIYICSFNLKFWQKFITT